MIKGEQKHDEVMTYFFEKYNKASFRVVPGHWPNFKTKEEVDEYIDTTEKIMEAVLRSKEATT